MSALQSLGRSADSAQIRQFVDQVCQPARASSRLMFALMMALAAPAWRALGRRPAGFHFYGWVPGRDALASVPASLYGGIEITQWATVANELKRAAVIASDGLLVLAQDEEPHRLSMLRAINALWARSPDAGGTSRAPIPSRTDALTISVGDILIDQSLVFVAAPQAGAGGLWLVNVPSDAGRERGIFEEPVAEGHGDAIAVALLRLRGAIGLHWLGLLNANWPVVARALGQPSGFDAPPSGAVDVFTQVPTEDLALGFRTIAAAGELATEWGLTGWEPGEAREAVLTCERAWQAGNAARIDVAVGRKIIR